MGFAFQIAAPFHDGLTAVWIGDTMGYIDRTGRSVCEPAK